MRICDKKERERENILRNKGREETTEKTRRMTLTREMIRKKSLENVQNRNVLTIVILILNLKESNENNKLRIRKNEKIIK